MRAMVRILTLALVLSFPQIGGKAGAQEAPTRETHWLSLINTTHTRPTNMRVVIVPPGYVSRAAMVSDPSWATGLSPIADHPGVRAALEATSYWQWAVDQLESRWPHLAGLSYTTRVLGVDATPDDLANANIVVNTAMAGDPVPNIFHLGVGWPTYPAFSNSMSVCTVWNTGAGNAPKEDHVVRLRNLIIHEFGHCLAVGHTGTSLNAPHRSRTHGVFDQHPTDVMSSVFGTHRQCISNINVQSLAEGYDWLRTGSTWTRHDGETFMLKSEYAELCMPDSMNRF
ncbi:MAG TPA: hypothetical protein VNE62_03600 [Actinomycetota bacterium]|nr:hypothetical protein [Actinomycetota bacterium]